ncbi:MAG: WHG domain-containing protein [Actinomycetales bacterium]|nr:WHG domain-containing protein [Actinomycetales bacterium]
MDDSREDAERRYHHGDLRAALIEAAVAQVDEVGLEHLSLRAAAASVGVSPSAAYHHFADKDALMAAVALAANACLDEAMQRAVGEVSGIGARAARARVRAAARAYLAFALEHPHLFRAAFSGHAAAAVQDAATAIQLAPATGHDAPAGAPVDAHAAYGRASALLDQLVTTGAAPDSFRQGAEEIMWATIHGMATLMLEGYLDRRRIDDYLQDMERLMQLTSTAQVRASR